MGGCGLWGRGDLHPSKSYWYLVDFKMTKGGNWIYKKESDCPGELYLTLSEGGEESPAGEV